MKYLAVLFFALGMLAQAETPTVPFGSDCAFPEAFRSFKPVGNSEYSYTVAPDGTLHDVKVVRPSSNAQLDAAGAACIAHWRTTADSAWQGMIARKEAIIYWDVYAAKPVGRSSAGRPHSCAGFYPEEEKAAGSSGTTTVGFRILENGHIADQHIVGSSGNANLDNAALACVKDWRYLPAMKDGKPVAVDWRAQVRWSADPTGGW